MEMLVTFQSATIVWKENQLIRPVRAASLVAWTLLQPFGHHLRREVAAGDGSNHTTRIADNFMKKKSNHSMIGLIQLVDVIEFI